MRLPASDNEVILQGTDYIVVHLRFIHRPILSGLYTVSGRNNIGARAPDPAPSPSVAKICETKIH